MAGQLPDDVLSIFGAEQARLEASGSPTDVAVPGEPMPDAQLLDVNGTPITLSEAVDGSGAVVVFYRGAWCPYCNLTLRAYQEDLVPHLAERDIPLVAISPQKPDRSLSTQEANGLTWEQWKSLPRFSLRCGHCGRAQWAARWRWCSSWGH